MSSTKSTKTITVQHRGPFNDDSFFKDSWDEWDHAMKDAVERWDKHSGPMGKELITAQPEQTKSVYRQIRSSNVSSDESQAVSCTEEDDKYKMVMDVRDFNPEDINVKAVDDTVVVEGLIERREGNSITTNKFTRRFLLPAGVNMNAVSSALSRDGVLTISAPKFAASRNSETVIPTLRADDTITGRVMGPMPRSSVTKTYFPRAAAGRPSISDGGPFNPTGGGKTAVYETPKKDRLAHMVDGNTSTCIVDSDRRGSSSQPTYSAPCGRPTATDNGTFNPTGGSNTSVFETPKKDRFAHMIDGTTSSGVVDPDRKGSINSMPMGIPTRTDGGFFNPTGGSNTSIFETPKKDRFAHMVDGKTSTGVVDSDRKGSVNWTPLGKPTATDHGHFNPTGGSNTTVFEVPKKDRFAHMDGNSSIGVVDSDRSKPNWSSFNDAVEKSHREIEEMMKKHTLSADVEVPLPLSHAMPQANVISPLNSAGINVSKDVVRTGNTLTHRQEQKWNDQPAPGVSRKNRDYQESSDIMGDDGEVVGTKKKKEQESHAEGKREEILPDGTKCKIFTKSYETKNSYVASRGHPKAL